MRLSFSLIFYAIADLTNMKQEGGVDGEGS